MTSQNSVKNLFYYLPVTSDCSLPTENVTEIKTNIFVTSFGPVSDTEMVSWTANDKGKRGWTNTLTHTHLKPLQTTVGASGSTRFIHNLSWKSSKTVSILTRKWDETDVNVYILMQWGRPVPACSKWLISLLIRTLMIYMVPPGWPNALNLLLN